MFKKTISTIALLGAFSAPAMGAELWSANNFVFKPYVGAEYQYTDVQYEDDVLGSGFSGDQLAADSIHGVNVHVGARIHKHLGVEAGYLWTGDAEKSDILGTGLDSSVKVRGFTVDALGYLPIGVSEKVELIGTVGVSRLKATYTIPTVGSDSDTETKGRIGGGAQFWVTDHLNIRGLVRYQGADFDNVVKSAVTANVGVNFQF